MSTILILLLLLMPLGPTWITTVEASAGGQLTRIGADDFRISQMGPDGDTAFGAFWFLVPNMAPSVAFGSIPGEYLVVWFADDNTPPLVDDEFEIFGQRVNAATGALEGDRFRISFMGPDGNPDYDALLPSVVYNSIENEYLVVWVADHSTAQLVNDHFEVFARRVSTTGQLLGPQSRLSEMGSSGDPNVGAAWWVRPDVAYNEDNNVYLVAWCGDKIEPPYVDNEFEIWGQRFEATLTPADGDEVILSSMGTAGSTDYSASQPAIAWDSDHNSFLVVWEGDHTEFGLVDNEFEIFGRFVPGDPAFPIIILGPHQISLMGGANGESIFDAFDPDVAYNEIFDTFLVTWVGDDNTWPTADGEIEVYGRLLTWDGAFQNSQMRLSAMGQSDGNPAFSAHSPAVISHDESYTVAWHGDHDLPPMVNDEFEIFTTSISADPSSVGLVNQSRLTAMGADGDPTRGAFIPALAYDFVFDRGLLVWWGDDNTPPLVDDEFEVFGRLLEFPTIFSDGFESGDTSRWSASTP